MFSEFNADILPLLGYILPMSNLFLVSSGLYEPQLIAYFFLLSACILLKEMGFGEERIEYVEDRKGHDYRYAIDASKIKKELGWKQDYTFEKGLKETILWYKKNEKWWKPLKT